LPRSYWVDIRFKVRVEVKVGVRVGIGVKIRVGTRVRDGEEINSITDILIKLRPSILLIYLANLNTKP
jgi:hypothetical protein